jgi:hypothetical protein
MKRLILLFICSIAASCNPGVFIEPLELAETEFELPFTGGTVEISASHGDWEVQNVTVDHIDAWWVSEGRMIYESNFMSFEITRPQPSRLVLTLDESVDSNPSLIQIYIGNEYISKVVSVNVGACRGYSFDRVEYGDPVVVPPEDAFEQVWSKTVKNDSGEPMVWECPVFDARFCRTLWFPAEAVTSVDMPYVMWYETLMRFVEAPFDVPVPYAVLSDGDLTFSGETVEFCYEVITRPVEFEELTASVNLAPGNNAVKMFWGYIEYEVPYTMWFKHPGEGRDLCFKGKFISKAYDGRWRVEL